MRPLESGPVKRLLLVVAREQAEADREVPTEQAAAATTAPESADPWAPLLAAGAQLLGELAAASQGERQSTLVHTDPATGQPAIDEEGNLVYPRSRDYTRDEATYPQYAGTREWFTFQIGDTLYYVLAGDPTFMKSIFNVIFFALVVIPLQTGLGLLLALLVNQKLKGRNFFRTIYFSPVVTAMVVVSFVWMFLYDKDNGLINQFIGLIGLQDVNWLGNPNTAMWAIIIMSVWQGVGMQMVLFLAGLQGIPDYLYEASSIDGANAWQNFRYVTLPSLRGVFVFIIITITIAAFQLFTQVWVMTNGGPDDATTTVVFNMVRKGFREQDIAMASAIGVLFFLFIIGISLVQRFVLRDKEA